MSYEKVPIFFPNLFEAGMNENGTRIYRFKSFLLNVGERQLFNGESEVPLTPKTFDVLVHLVENAGRLVRKDDLMQAVWPDSFVEEVNIPRSVHHLRKSLGHDNNGNKFIETVPTKGYRFIVPVEVPDIPPSESELYKPRDPEIDVDPGPRPNSAAHKEHPRRRTFPIWLTAAAAALLGIGIAITSSLWRPNNNQSDLLQASLGDAYQGRDSSPAKLYWGMSDVEQVAFIRKRSESVQTLIGDAPVELDDRIVRLIKVELDDFVSRNQSVSDRPFREPIKRVYERAAQDAEEVADYFESVQLRGALGIYQAMVESEYHQCLISPTGSVGIFQISKKDAIRYDLDPDGFCHIGRNSEAASRYMGDISQELLTDQGTGTLSLFAHRVGVTQTLEYLRDLRKIRVWERSVWAILRNRSALSKPVPDSAERYIARFFAAAVIGETPIAFNLPTQPLSTIKTRGRTANP